MSNDVRSRREAIIEALPANTSLDGGLPEPRHVYVPPSDIKALRPESTLVIGGRGVGKSFWSAALRTEQVRKMLGTAVPILPNIKVSGGFGEKPDVAHYPDSDTFASLLGAGYEPYHIWRAVIGRWAKELAGQGPVTPDETWEQSVNRIKADPEGFARLLERANRHLAGADSHGMIVFDALDRSSDAWPTMDAIVKDILRVALAIRPYDRLHAKVFLREDQYDGRVVANFPDASKLQANRVELT